jgi:integrase
MTTFATPGGKTKFASARDLRRSFGARWATRVTTGVLQKMMRHADIATTTKYYADLDANTVESAIYAGNKIDIKVDATESV